MARAPSASCQGSSTTWHWSDGRTYSNFPVPNCVATATCCPFRPSTENGDPCAVGVTGLVGVGRDRFFFGDLRRDELGLPTCKAGSDPKSWLKPNDMDSGLLGSGGVGVEGFSTTSPTAAPAGFRVISILAIAFRPCSDISTSSWCLSYACSFCRCHRCTTNATPARTTLASSTPPTIPPAMPPPPTLPVLL